MPLYPIGQQRCFGVPRMGVFEMDNAKKYCLGSGVAPQKPIPLYPIGQQKCFGVPRMGLFEMDNAKKYCLGSGVAPKTLIPLYPIGQQRCFWIPGMGVFEMDNAEKIVWVVGGAPNTHRIPWAREGVFGYLGWRCLKCAMPKNIGVWRGAPSAHTSAPNLPERVFLDT